MSDQIEEIRLQRLVDGALSADEQREFLAGLDSTPELWREVALAFVEEQVFRTELGAIRQLPDALDATAVKPRRPATRFLAISLSLAVSLLLVFGLGVQREELPRCGAGG